MPTIRIDEQVYEWLQKQANAFEDTPNSVMRRVAGLETKNVSGPRSQGTSHRSKRQRTASGRQLARREGLDVKKAYYHWEGTFYQRVNEFPVALFDQHGYVILKSRTEYLNHAKIGGNERTNIPDGIASFPQYTKMNRPAF